MLCVVFESKFEAPLLLNKFEEYEAIRYPHMVIYETNLNGKELILVQTGEGKVNVAYAVGCLKEKYPVTAFIGFGNCGYIGEHEIPIGDIAISNFSLQYDVDFEANHFRPFEIPGVNKVVFPSDNHLKQYALMACHYLEYEGHIGLFGTADRFISSSIIAPHLNQSYHFEFVDVESAVIGQIASIQQIPFVTVKGIAHYGDDEAYDVFKQSFQKVNERASDVIYTMLEALTRKNMYC